MLEVRQLAKRKPKAKTRKISYRRATSYERMRRNGGVTTIVEVNGRGSFAKRNSKGGSVAKKVTKDAFIRAQERKGRTPAQAAADWKLRQRSVSGKAKVPSAKSARRTRLRRPLPRETARTGPRRAKRKTAKPNLRGSAKKAPKKTKAQYIRSQERGGRSSAQAANDWRLKQLAAKRRREAAKAKPKAKTKRRSPTYSGKRAVKARVGSGPKARSKRTYMARTKSGNYRKIPDYALMGYKSAQAMGAAKRGTSEQRRLYERRRETLLSSRASASRKASERAARGRAWFSPNPGEILQLEEWSTSSMKRNARKKKASKPKTKASFIRRQRRSGRSAAQAEASWKLRQGALKRHRAGLKRAAAAKSAPKRRRRKTTKKKKRATKRKRPLAKRTCRTAASRLARCRPRKKRASPKRRPKAGPGWGAPRKYKRNSAKRRSTRRRSTGRRRSLATVSRRPKSTRRRTTARRRTYRRNASGAAWRHELSVAFKAGLRVTIGFSLHRVATNLVDQHGLSKIAALQSGGLATWRKVISGALVAAVGIPAITRLLPSKAQPGQIAAGMVGSLLFGALQITMSEVYPQAVPALSAYTNAEGYAQYSGMGAYYTMSPHQVYGGMGEFYETSPIPGLEQAAAGFGLVEGQQLMQAAAGMGQPQLQQMYANPAGVGEFFAANPQGIGDYESVPSSPDGLGRYTHDGIQPNLNSAEMALNVAEAQAGVDGQQLTQAAAGFGSNDIPLQQTVTPMIRAFDIPDQPGGSRAGILAGGDGIFG